MGIDILVPDCLLGLGNFYPKGRNMTKQDIIRMAQEAQMPFYWRTSEITYLDKLERFAALVASAERERIKQANASEIERINAHIKELERDAARYREVREWDFCGYDHCLISPESFDREADNIIRARGQA